MSVSTCRPSHHAPLEDTRGKLGFLENEMDIIALRQRLRYPPNFDAGLNTTLSEDRFQTGFHPCGTCRLGKDVSKGVVDDKLKVFRCCHVGVDKLRVV
ncbi:SMG1 [Diaporthe helianthi]|uniref:SMG1 n=1 Tax=Diaporthe helianthi TaxID=158607 RepID=A0A2P5HYA4_DIAHE|nr:SMG1 [Diaporthe helianthi]